KQYAVISSGDRPLPWPVIRETMRHHCFPGCIGKHVAAQAYQSAGWNIEFQMLHIALTFHHQHLAPALCNKVNYSSAEFLRHIHYKVLIRFTFLTINFFYDNGWLSYGQFITFPSHGID